MQHWQEHFAAPIRDLVEDLAVALGRVCRPHDVDVYFIFDAPVRITWRFVQVNDASVQRMSGGKFSLRLAYQTDVRSCSPKSHALCEWLHAVNV
jgi:hypothetical protein